MYQSSRGALTEEVPLELLAPASEAAAAGEVVSDPNVVVSSSGRSAAPVSRKPEVMVLFLPPWADEKQIEKHKRAALKVAQLMVGDAGTVRLIQCEPPYSEDEKFEPSCYWLKPRDRDPDRRRKMLRKQIFAGLVSVLSDVAKYRAVAIIGSEQGGLISLLCARSLVLEVACRARILTAKEMRNAREAWCGVVTIIAINPVMLPQRSQISEIQAAVPEMGFAQPRVSIEQ